MVVLLVMFVVVVVIIVIDGLDELAGSNELHPPVAGLTTGVEFIGIICFNKLNGGKQVTRICLW